MHLLLKLLLFFALFGLINIDSKLFIETKTIIWLKCNYVCIYLNNNCNYASEFKELHFIIIKPLKRKLQRVKNASLGNP